MSVLYGPVTSPKSAAWWTRSATFALQISFLLGRQLMLGHEPPIHRRSTTAVRCPAPAMSQARSFPPAPLPRMRTSYRSVGMVISLTRWCRLPKRRDHLRGEQLEMTLCPPRRQAPRELQRERRRIDHGNGTFRRTEDRGGALERRRYARCRRRPRVP